MTEVVKTCNKHGDLTLKDLKVGIYKGKQYKKCRKCEIERSREYYKKLKADPDAQKRLRKKDKDYWENNKEKIKERRIKNNDPAKRREQYKKLAPRYRENCNLKQKEYRENLSDTYMRRIIQNGNKSIPLMSIPQGMLKLKRAIMLGKKEIKKINESKLKEKIPK